VSLDAKLDMLEILEEVSASSDFPLRDSLRRFVSSARFF
jgi:hypothetical protein